MPEEGIDYAPRTDLLSFEEMERLIKILGGMGVSKVRITGGEPFVRKDLISFLERISGIQELKELPYHDQWCPYKNIYPKTERTGNQRYKP